MKTQQILTLNSQKVHSVRYDQKDDKNDRPFICVYIRKEAFPGGVFPKEITVTVEA